MARKQRDTKAEYQRRKQRALDEGWKSYPQKRKGLQKLRKSSTWETLTRGKDPLTFRRHKDVPSRAFGIIERGESGETGEQIHEDIVELVEDVSDELEIDQPEFEFEYKDQEGST